MERGHEDPDAGQELWALSLRVTGKHGRGVSRVEFSHTGCRKHQAADSDTEASFSEDSGCWKAAAGSKTEAQVAQQFLLV